MVGGGITYNMVMLRDPLGSSVYSGDWNKDDPGWTTVLLTAMTSATGISDLTVAALDGVFMSPIENLLEAKCFGYIQIGVPRYQANL